MTDAALVLRPVSLRAANEYISENHRHHGKCQGYKFAIGLFNSTGNMVGVAVVGRPVSRIPDDGVSAEVTGLCTDGSRNACSKLYSASWRAAKAMGYLRMFTYTLASETGVSLKASGWRKDTRVNGRSWDTPSRRRTDKHPTEDKQRWVVIA